MHLYSYQREAVDKLKTGKILCGGVGSGKSITSLVYFYENVCGGRIDGGLFVPIRNPKNLYIITTAMKRDKKEWDQELVPFLLSRDKDPEEQYGVSVVIDSWQNIKKYIDIKNSFFIFDEDKVIGRGAWVKTFYKIAANNDWIILSATPGDTWSDYIPVFVANGFFKNRTSFITQHAVYDRYSKYPKIDYYINTGILQKYRRDILVNMDDQRKTIQHHINVDAEYDRKMYKEISKTKWDPFNNEPFINAASFCHALRRVVNSDPSRVSIILDLLDKTDRAIIFYNYNYELDILRNIPYKKGTVVAEWNGFKHEPLPESDKWVYLVQYTAGAEGWECIKTDTIIFYSQNYSYKTMVQAAGRIDRVNTPFTDLYYYHIKSRSSIDYGIADALRRKKKFNESRFAKF